MAWTNASGTPVAVKPQMIQLDLPCEQVGDEGAAVASINWIALMVAVFGLITALKTGDPMAIAAAIQALIKAVTGG